MYAFSELIQTCVQQQNNNNVLASVSPLLSPPQASQVVWLLALYKQRHCHFKADDFFFHVFQIVTMLIPNQAFKKKQKIPKAYSTCLNCITCVPHYKILIKQT